MPMFTVSDPPSKDLHNPPPTTEFNTKSLHLQTPTPKPHLSHNPSPISEGDLTLSYLCENPKLSLSEDESIPASSSNLILSLEKPLKCEEIAASVEGEQLRIERDFLHLKSITGIKREGPEHCKTDGCKKKVRIETLNLTLAPPDLSLSIHSANPPPPPRRAFSSSEDFAPSLSQSCSVPFSHNPSCSLTRNSSENFDVLRDNGQMLQCGAGEGTNGSVHSRFRPLGDGNSITFTNHSGFPRRAGDGKDANHNGSRVYRANNCVGDELSFHAATVSSEGGRKVMLSRPDKVLKGIVSESVPIMAQMWQEFPSKLIEEVKDCLRNMMDAPEEFSSLQRKLERRADLTLETLSKCHRVQLEILVVIKTAVSGFLSAKNRIPTSELIEIFLMTRCKNPSCKSLLPVDECDCGICANNKGFCSACMCPICFKFDCASNTCSWVGCDVCSHWCHAICGIQKNLIKPGPSLKGGGGMTEMQFYCPGCDHASEMLGFVKEVFMCCAKDWGLETLMKELECVKMIFQASQDLEGKELQRKTAEKLTMLGKKQISPIDACNAMLQFFKYGVSDLSVTGGSSKNKFAAQAGQQENILSLPSIAAITPSKTTFTLKSNPTILESIDALISDTTPKVRVIEPQFVQTKDGSFQSLDTVVRLKEAESKLFQRLADEAQREMESYHQIARAKAEKLEQEYTTKLAKLCLHEAEEQHRKKLEELKFLENSHCDYQSMQRRMQAEMSSLLDLIETTRKQWV